MTKGSIYLSLLFIIALTIRIIFVLVAPHPDIVKDAYEYDMMGWNVASGNGFSIEPNVPTVARTPSYPVFLSLIYLIFGHNPLIVRVVQAILSAITTLFIYAITKMLSDKKSACLAYCISVFYPSFISANILILSEPLYIFLLTFSILVLIKALINNKTSYYVTSGLLLGVGILCRPEAILFPIFFVVLKLILQKKALVKNIITWFFICYLIVSFWALRNYIVFKKVVIMSSVSGSVLFAGNYLPWDGVWRSWNEEPLRSIIAESGKYSIETDRKLWKEGMKNLERHPFKIAGLYIKKLARLYYFPYTGGIAVGRAHMYFYEKVIYMLSHLFVMIGSLIAIIYNRKRWKDYIVIYLFIAYLSLVHMLGILHVRYLFGFMSFFVILAGIGYMKLYNSYKPKFCSPAESRQAKFAPKGLHDKIRRGFYRICPEKFVEFHQD